MLINDKKTIISITLLSIFLILFLVIAIVVIPLNKKIPVSISTDPKEATFTVNSESGKTPAKIKLKPGNYKIDISKDGYQSFSSTFKVNSSEKNVTLSYSLKRNPHQPSSKALEENFGGGKPDPNWESKQEAVNKKYNFISELPYHDEGNYYYISRPTYDDKFFVYLSKVKPDEAKMLALDWFDRKGIPDAEKTLKIIWQYR